MSVILETSIGDITVDLYVKERPRACLNFLKLCKLKYYNFHLFHTIQHNFIAQTGDPTGTGRGGESVYSRLYGEQAKYFEAEPNPKIKHTKNGTLSMVNDGNGRHGSQFFITLSENSDYLDKQNHTVFGEVSEGFEIIEKLNSTILDDNNRPMKDVRIYHTVVLDDPLPDPPGLDELIPCNSPAANTQEHLEPRIGADSDTDDEKGLTQEELDEISKDREARTNAKILEVIGDLPDADIKPPDNVLFVCKLNPATTDNDIEIIFSRFGKIVSCEVIRNKKTNESLQYAFVEFEKAEDCEKAYFKMDNVLIDDRRIHVDFSQSVSKEYHRHKMEKEEDEGRPQYKIKDFEKRYDNYEYVFEPESERLPEKVSKKHNSRAKKPKRKNHSSSSEESDRSQSPAMNRKKCRSPLRDRKDRRGSPLEKRRNVESSPALNNRRRRSRSVEDRRKRRSPSEEDRRKKPSRENRRHRSPSPENNRRRRSPSGDERRPHKAERQVSDRRRDRSSEGDRNRRRSRSREDSSRKGGRYQDDRRERNNRPRNY